MPVTAGPATPDADEPRSGSTLGQGVIFRLMLTALLTGLACALLYLNDWRVFYWDDVQHTFAPVFYMIGERLREGDWPTTTLQIWQGGFLAGEKGNH